MTEKEKGVVEAYKDIGKSFRWIGNKLGRHEISIRHYCNNIDRKMRSVDGNRSFLMEQSVELFEKQAIKQSPLHG